MYTLTNLAGEAETSSAACLDADASTKPCWVRCEQVETADGPRRYMRANARWPDLADVGFSPYANRAPEYEGTAVEAPDPRFPSLRPHSVRFVALLFGAPVDRPGVQFPLDDFDARCINYERAARDPTWYDLQFREKSSVPGHKDRRKEFRAFAKEQARLRADRRAEFVLKKHHLTNSSGEGLAAAIARTLEAYPAENVDPWRKRGNFTRVARLRQENARAVAEAQAEAQSETQAEAQAEAWAVAEMGRLRSARQAREAKRKLRAAASGIGA